MARIRNPTLQRNFKPQTQRNIKRQKVDHTSGKNGDLSLHPQSKTELSNGTTQSRDFANNLVPFSVDDVENLRSSQNSLLRIGIKRLTKVSPPVLPANTKHKSRYVFSRSCSIRLEIRQLQQDTISPDGPLLFRDSRDALLQFYQTTDGIEGEIRLVKPFAIEDRKLFVALKHAGSWTYRLATNYEVNLSLCLLDPADLEEFLPLMFDSGTQPAGNDHAIFDASFTSSLKSAEYSTRLWYRSRSEKRTTSYNIGVDLQWYKTSRSAIEINNQMSRVQTSPQAEAVEFVFEGGQIRTWQQDDFKCPFCEQEAYARIDALDLHLKTNHQMLSFRRRPMEQRDGKCIIQFTASHLPSSILSPGNLATPPDSIRAAPGKLSSGSQTWIENGKWLWMHELRHKPQQAFVNHLNGRKTGLSVVTQSGAESKRHSGMSPIATNWNRPAWSLDMNRSDRTGAVMVADPYVVKQNMKIRPKDPAESPKSALKNSSHRSHIIRPLTANSSPKELTTPSRRHLPPGKRDESRKADGAPTSTQRMMPDGRNLMAPGSLRRQQDEPSRVMHPPTTNGAVEQAGLSGTQGDPELVTPPPLFGSSPGYNRGSSSQAPLRYPSGLDVRQSLSGVISPSASPHTPLFDTRSPLPSPRSQLARSKDFGQASPGLKAIPTSTVSSPLPLLPKANTPLLQRSTLHGDSTSSSRNSLQLVGVQDVIPAQDGAAARLYLQGQDEVTQSLTEISSLPEKVQMPVKVIRPKYPVPSVPHGVTLFRSKTKRPLTEGDDVSESEDEIDDSWLQLRHEEVIDANLEATPAGKEFMKRWDGHFAGEQLNGNKYAPNALQRFTAHNTEWLRKEQILPEYCVKLAAWYTDNLISWAVLTGCLEIVKKADLSQDVMGHKKRSSATDAGASVERVNKWSAVCCCGVAVTAAGAGADMRGIVSCANIACGNANYHIGCVGLSARPRLWYCSRCPKEITPTQLRNHVTA